MATTLYNTKPGRSVQWSLPLLSQLTTKPCEGCGKDIVRDIDMKPSRWEVVRFCSTSCASRFNQLAVRGCAA